MFEPILFLLLGIIVILAIIAANGYFVAQEFAYMAVDRTRLAAQAASGDADAKRALTVTNRTSFMLSGAQLGITVTGLLVGYVAEPLVGVSLGTLLGGVGVPTEVGIGVGTTLALVFATVVQMIFGELYPKNLAIASPDPLARALAVSTLVYLRVFGWLISFFDMSANLFLRMLRIEPVHDLDVSASVEDLPRIISDSRDSGDLPVELSHMMERIIDFPEQDVAHAMVPRSRADWVSPETTVGEVRQLMAKAHTRYPVIDESETPIGVVHLPDVMSVLDESAQREPVTTVMRPAFVLPSLMSLPDALEQMNTGDVQLACVVNEYGGFDGLLTMEDIAMEIVGEITDEHDLVSEAAVVQESDAVWVMDGDVHLDEVARLLDRTLPEEDVETIAGLLILEAGALPAVGDTVTVALPKDPDEVVDDNPAERRLKLDVLKIERHVPTRIRVQLIEIAE
ncbi:Hemolysin, contains CBS domains [Devosia lucknowensis]|uniref:Hemolysin, contains CBS domains n=1 Tax=Devosia lucknowensis TaxID=1096929 RepID=A0A1Y6F7P0_9HYPH|nr:hemolysin family protein [Devosia lucknowensis]SMQ68722.1 Hemolysin, contains CBS domains [Devosia lucknowensis]